MWVSVFSSSDENLHLIACDVGQGDAILAIQGSTQILIDGGPSGEVIDCLEEYVPYFDRTIELVIVTHPQLDHYGGIVNVLGAYDVENIMISSLDSSAKRYQVLKNAIRDSQAQIIDPVNVAEMSVGLMYLDIVHPTKSFMAENSTKVGDIAEADALGISESKRDPNDFSIVAVLRLGEFDALLTGDIRSAVIPEIIESGKIKDVEYIKVPHHGSKNGLTKELLDASTPELAVIQSGEGNRFGHPHKEVLELLRGDGIEILRNDELGDIEIVTNGTKYWIVGKN